VIMREDRGEWNKEDGEEQEKEEEDRKDDESTDEEAHTTKNLFQPASNILPNCVAQPVAEIFQGCDDLSGKETATLRCFLGDWLGFGDSEEEGDAEWEQDKEREAEDVSKEDGHAGEQYAECKGGTRIAKISEGR